MEGKTISIGIVVLVVLLGGWYLLTAAPAQAPAPAVSSETVETALPENVTIAYTAEGFSPKSLVVPSGTTVTFVNQTSDRMWVGSAMHPDHVVYDGTALAEHCATGYTGPAPFDQCAASANYSFTFLKAGSWGYHNHANAAHFGSVVVTAP